MMRSLSLLVFLLTILLLATTIKGQLSCGSGTRLDESNAECVCSEVSSSSSLTSNKDNVVSIAGIFDTTAYDWGPDVFETAVQLINKGWWDVLPPGYRLEYAMANANCSEIEAMRGYWDIRKANGNQPMQGIVGARCTGVAIPLARLGHLEGVPVVSFAASSAKLSVKEDGFDTFSRLVAPNDERGQVGAAVQLMRLFGWDRIGILATDMPYAKDMASDLRSIWTREGGNWTGTVAFFDTIRIENKTVNLDSLENVMESIPTDPETTTRVIYLAAHPEHAFPILRKAQELLPKDTIWVGPAAWAGRDDLYEHQEWLAEYPGYLGVAPYRNRDQVYQDFMSALKAYQRTKPPPEGGYLTELPTFAAELVDSVRAMAKAIVAADNPQDGYEVVRNLRQLEFDGVSGHVAFTSVGDRKDPLYTIYNAQFNANKTAEWVPVGTAGTTEESTSFLTGVESVCFAEFGCGLEAPPENTYPLPRYYLPGWAIFLVVFLSIVFLALVYVTQKYRRSRRSKHNIKAELNSLRNSVVGMRTAECKYIPQVTRKLGDLEQGTDLSSSILSLPAIKTVKWMWRETHHVMDKHSADVIYGDPKDCWILYSEDCSQKIETAYQSGKKSFEPLPGYEITFDDMRQTKLATGFIREIQRVSDDDDMDTTAATTLTVEVGDKFPAELEGEPRMVLCEQDIIQVSKQRKDGWAFGTKLHHSDETTARQLVAVAILNGNTDDDLIMADTGWFPEDKTRVPTVDDLRPLQKNVGDAGALDPPSHWSAIQDPSLAQKKRLLPGDPERVKVEVAFMATHGTTVRVLDVERIENLAMWQSYVVKRQTVCSREIGGQIQDDDDALQQAIDRFERRWLFHGSSIETVEKIIQQGFNRSFCGKNATLHGKGVYFARDANYSSCTTYAAPDPTGKQYVMACRVLVGEYCKGQRDALTPQVRDHATQTLYDSTVDNVSDPCIYVTYHDAQAYPEYLITFTSFSYDT